MPLAPGVTLQPHQQRVVDEASAAAQSGEPYRKLLLWQMGSGKTPGAVAVADALGAPSTAVVPAALRTNYRQTVDAFAPDGPPAEVLSYNQIARGRAPAPDSRTLLFDEGQRATSPGSAQARAARHLAAGAKNLVVMSGTIARNDPAEFAPVFEMLTGRPTSHEAFRRRYVKEETTYPGGLVGRLLGRPPVTREVIDRPDELKALLAGKVDFYEPADPPVGVTHHTVEAELTKPQARLYEAMYGRLPWLLRWKLKRNYPLSADELARTRSFLTGPRQVGLSTLPYMAAPDPLRAFKESGKLLAAHANLKTVLDADPRTKAIVYSNFVRAGLDPYAAALAHGGVPHAVFHGGLSDAERKDLVRDFNDGKIRVALVAPSGAEGVSFRGAQLVQVLDNHWNESRTDQAFARGIRFDSHSHLPPDLQYVRAERYRGVLPASLKHRLFSPLGLNDPADRETADHYLDRMAAHKQQLLNQFNRVLRASTFSPAIS